MNACVYRIYGDGGKLLYVGCSLNPFNRHASHASGKPWWTSVERITLTHYETRTEAFAAEKEAIMNELPLFNVTHNSSPDSSTPDAGHLFQPNPFLSHIEIDEVSEVPPLRENCYRPSKKNRQEAPKIASALGWNNNRTIEWCVTYGLMRLKKRIKQSAQTKPA